MARNGSRRPNGQGPRPLNATPGPPAGLTDIGEKRPTGAGRITVTLPDGTMLTLIGVPRLLIAAADGMAMGVPSPA